MACVRGRTAVRGDAGHTLGHDVVKQNKSATTNHRPTQSEADRCVQCRTLYQHFNMASATRLLNTTHHQQGEIWW